ncbi:MAG: flagellar hook-length control protein FliK, partial [Selenomonadaceae bacterium]|nr:flagellar hook-length control protein FliK [Selenomonadaceae bacterium]
AGMSGKTAESKSKDAGKAPNDTGKVSNDMEKNADADADTSLETAAEAGAATSQLLQFIGNLQTDMEVAAGQEQVSAIETLGDVAEADDFPGEWIAKSGRESEMPSPNLQTLLPQSGEQTAKHQQMLAMLSGQMVKGANQQDMQQTGISPGQMFDGDASSGQDMQQSTVMPGNQRMPSDPLSAQSLQMARNFAVDGSELQSVVMRQENVEGRQMLQGADVMRQPTAVPVAAESMTASVQAPLQTRQEQQPVNQGDKAALLNGVQITVEEEAMPPVEGLRQQLMQQQPRQQQQQEPQEQQMPFRQMMSQEPDIMESGETTVRDGEPALRQPEGNAPTVPAFQQTMQNVNRADQTSTASSAQQARDDFDIPQQIVEQARLIRAQESTEMVIRLKPEHLGNLTLRISVSNEGAVTASFFSDNAQVRHIVENSLVQLRQELENQGIKVDKAEVYAGLSDGQLPQEQGQQAWQQQGQGNSSAPLRSLKADMDTFEETTADLSSVENLAEDSVEDGVNYLV